MKKNAFSDDIIVKPCCNFSMERIDYLHKELEAFREEYFKKAYDYLDKISSSMEEAACKSVKIEAKDALKKELNKVLDDKIQAKIADIQIEAIESHFKKFFSSKFAELSNQIQDEVAWRIEQSNQEKNYDVLNKEFQRVIEKYDRILEDKFAKINSDVLLKKASDNYPEYCKLYNLKVRIDGLQEEVQKLKQSKARKNKPV